MVPRMCIDRRLPALGTLQIADRSVAERAANAPPAAGGPALSPEERLRLALETAKRWRTGRTLRIRFLDGDPAVHARVEAAAVEWTRHANVRFAFGDEPDAEIRIAFGAGGSWSWIGTEALAIPAARPTMNFGWLTRDTPGADLGRVVLHEFGHALGCIHEHQSPAGGIPWDREAVYAAYAQPPNGWDRATVDRNIFQAYAGETTQFTGFDERSIMLYPIPRALTVGGFEVGWNRALSATDIGFIGAIYPFPSAALVPLVCDVPPVEGEIAAPGDAVRYGFTVPAPARYVLETTGATDLAMELLGPDTEAHVAARDAGGGLGGNARIATVLMDGAYAVVLRHQRPSGTGRYAISLRSEPG